MAKGFDTVPHNVLLHQLSFNGFSNSTVNLFESYFNDRFQNGDISSELPINFGIPQGLILGSILFNLYINDLILSLKTVLLMGKLMTPRYPVILKLCYTPIFLIQIFCIK